MDRANWWHPIFGGARVYSAIDEHVGDINEIIISREGKIVAVGVGGFLGIGEKDVAVPFNAVEDCPRHS